MTYAGPGLTSLRDFKQGALLHVLVALIRFGPSGKDRLHRKTGWSDEAVQDALDVLMDADYNLVIAMSQGRWPIYAATATARQLFLPLEQIMVTPLPAESGRGSSGLIHESDSDSDSHIPLLPPVTPLPAESDAGFPTGLAGFSTASPQPDRQPFGPEVAALVGLLKALGCSQDRAIACVTQALNRGESAAAVAEKITSGRAYAASPAGRGIHRPGYWLAACLADGRAIPQPPPDLDEHRYDGYLEYADNLPDERDTPDA